MIRCGLAVFALLCLSCRMAAGEVATGKALLETCNSAEAVEQEACLDYVAGVVDGLVWGATIAAFRSGATEAEALRARAQEYLGACPPGNASGKQLSKAAVAFMSANPRLSDQRADALINQARIAFFPC
jgi:hypothetical protein